MQVTLNASLNPYAFDKFPQADFYDSTFINKFQICIQMKNSTYFFLQFKVHGEHYGKDINYTVQIHSDNVCIYARQLGSCRPTNEVTITIVALY